MIRIPTVRDVVQDPRPLSAPRVAVPISDYGEPIRTVGEAMARLGSVAAAIGARNEEWQIETQVKERENLLSEAIRKTLHDPERGYLNLPGKAAIEGREAAVLGLRDHLGKLVDSLPDERAREVFGLVAGARVERALQQIDEHTARQERVYNIGETKARLETALSDAVANVGEPDEVSLNAGIVAMEAQRLAQLEGLGEDGSKALLRDYNSRLHEGVVERLLAGGHVADAREYFASLQPDQIDPQRATALRSVVRRATVADESIKLAIDIEREVDARSRQLEINRREQEFVGTGANFADVLAELEATTGAVPASASDLLTTGTEILRRRFEAGNLPGLLFDAAMQRLRATAEQRSMQRAEDARQNLQAAERWLTDNPFAPPSELPPRLYEDLRATGQLDAVFNFADGRRYSTDPKVRAEVLSWDRAQWSRFDSEAQVYQLLRGKLNDKHLDDALARWRDARGKSTRDDAPKIDQDLQLKTAARRLGILPTDRKPTEAEAAAFDEFQLDVLTAAETTPGATPAEKLRKTLADYERDQVSVAGRKKPFALVTEAEQGDAYIMTKSGRQVFLKNIDPAERQQILRAIESYNAEARRQNAAGAFPQWPIKPTTVEQIVEEWNKAQIEDRAKRQAALPPTVPPSQNRNRFSLGY